MSEFDRRFRDAVKAERDRIAGEAAATAASERMQSRIGARIEELTEDFVARERCRFLVPTLTQTEFGLFGLTFRPSDEALDIIARLQDRPQGQRRPGPAPNPVTLRIGRFSDLAEVTAAAVTEQLAKSFVLHETAIRDQRAIFARLEEDLRDGDAAISVPNNSRMLIWGGMAILVLVLLVNLAL
jgi:hypothetical protein